MTITPSPRGSNALPAGADSSALATLMVLLAILGIAARLAVASISIGTNDTLAWEGLARSSARS